jgi:SAM-dependent methyltransferase
MAKPYYASGNKLKTKNLLAGGAALDVPAFALSKVLLDDVTTAVDAGCGWGRFAIPLLQAAPRLERFLCCDVWPGMVDTCRTSLREAGLTADFVAADVRQLPLGDDSADLVMANHMLCELDDVPAAISELARVVRLNGQLLATTYSDAVRVPMTELHFATLAEVGHPYPKPMPSSFSLENGRGLLLEAFEAVESDVLEETRSSDDADAMLALYLQTGGYDWASRDESIPPPAREQIPTVFLSLARRWIEQEGAITTVTRWATFAARSPRRNAAIWALSADDGSRSVER